VHLSIFTPVELLDFIFQLGVVFAIYGFLWGLIELGFRILTASRKRSLAEVYVIRGIKYIFLADVTFMFCFDGDVTNKMDLTTQLVLAGVILLTYFIGKLQKNQNRSQMFKIAGNMMPKQATQLHDSRIEILIIALAIATFGALTFYPQYANNGISKWFVDSIVDIESTVIIGFIFKVIGFFFLMNLVAKVFTGVSQILSGGRQTAPKDPFNANTKDDDGFDDYEELN